MGSLKLKKDFVIPKGTVFKLKDSDTTFYRETNYDTLIDINKDNCGWLIVGVDVDDEMFEREEETNGSN